MRGAVEYDPKEGSAKETDSRDPQGRGHKPPISAIKMVGNEWAVQLLPKLSPGIEHRHFSERKHFRGSLQNGIEAIKSSAIVR
jgi:hypothetical protein